MADPVTSNGSVSPLPEPVDTREFIQLLREKIWLILGVTFGAFLIGRLYAYHLPLIYESKAVLEVKQEIPQLMSVEAINSKDLRDVQVLNTFVKKVTHNSVLQRVVQSNNLAANPVFTEGFTNTPSEEDLVRRLRGIVDARLQQNSRLIDVVAEHTDPGLAKMLANAVAKNFIAQEKELRATNATSDKAVLMTRAEQLKKNVEKEQQALQEFERTNDMSFAEGLNSMAEKLKEYSKQLSEAKTKRMNLEGELGDIEKVKDNPEALLKIESVRQDQQIVALSQEVQKEEAMVNSYTNRWKPGYPRMQAAQEKLNNMRAQLKDLILRSPGHVRAAYDSAKGREITFQNQYDKAKKDAEELNQKAIPYNMLKGILQQDKEQYDSLVKKIAESKATEGMEKTAIDIADYAQVPTRPAKPNRPQIMLISVLSGLFVSLLFIFIIHRFDTSIKTVDQAEKVLNLPVLGAVPIDKNPKVKLSPLVMVNEPHSICAESFRSLRATIGMLGRESERRIFLFTSAVPAEGKTFSCVNYALCQAQQGQRTLLIDFDLRRPAVAPSFSLPAETPGVTHYLLGKDTFMNLVRATQHENLSVLTAGPKVPNPAEQLTGSWVKQLMAEAAQHFDRVIIDTPPLNAISDTLYLLPFAQVICLVVRAGVTPKKAVKRAIETMHRANAYPSGAVLNCLPESSGYGYYYYYSTSDGYKSKGVYGATSEKSKVGR